MYRMTPTALEDTGVRIKVKDTRRRSASRRSSAERMRDQGSLQSRQLPQRAQTILQWISSIRSPQRSQKWTRSSMLGRGGADGGLGRVSMQLVHYIA